MNKLTELKNAAAAAAHTSAAVAASAWHVAYAVDTVEAWATWADAETASNDATVWAAAAKAAAAAADVANTIAAAVAASISYKAAAAASAAANTAADAAWGIWIAAAKTADIAAIAETASNDATVWAAAE